MKKLLTYCILPIAIIVLAFFLFKSINAPVKFNKELDARKAVAVERLKDIRTLQVTYKSVHGKYAPTMDSLIDFYNNGKITVVMQIGSWDDSVAVANTERIKKAHKGITDAKLYEMLKRGEVNNVIIKVPEDVAVKDTLFNGRPNFNIEELRYIPFSEGDTVIMASANKLVSGVIVPLFEAQMPFNSLLKGMDHQLVVNKNFEMTDTDRYPGYMVGSIDNPNNNAGNWE